MMMDKNLKKQETAAGNIIYDSFKNVIPETKKKDIGKFLTSWCRDYYYTTPERLAEDFIDHYYIFYDDNQVQFYKKRKDRKL